MTQTYVHFLGDLERAIMEVIWQRGKATVRDVVDELQSERRPAYTTVMTVMTRLVEKRMLRRMVTQQSYHYSAVLPKDRYLERTSRDAVSQFVSYFGDVAIAHFLDAIAEVDPKKIAELRKKLRRS